MTPNIKSELPFTEPVERKPSRPSVSPSQSNQAGQSRQNGTTPLPYQQEEDANTRIGRLYNKVLAHGPWTRYTIYILPVAIILLIPIIVGATIPVAMKNKPKIGGVRLQWFFTWFEGVWLSFWVSRGIAALTPVIFNYFAGARSLTSDTKKYTRVLENLLNPLTIFGWVIVSFVLYGTLFSTAAEGNRPKGWTHTFKKVLGGSLSQQYCF